MTLDGIKKINLHTDGLGANQSSFLKDMVVKVTTQVTKTMRISVR